MGQNPDKQSRNLTRASAAVWHRFKVAAVLTSCGRGCGSVADTVLLRVVESRRRRRRLLARCQMCHALAYISIPLTHAAKGLSQGSDLSSVAPRIGSLWRQPADLAADLPLDHQASVFPLSIGASALIAYLPTGTTAEGSERRHCYPSRLFFLCLIHRS